MLNLILNSDFARDWIKNREANLQDEINFYGHILTEKEWKTDLVNNFFEQTWAKIVKVLPDIWYDIQARVRDTLDWKVLYKAEEFDDYVGYGAFSSEYVSVPFDLSKYLGELEQEILKTLASNEQEAT
jgi:hypothetical protein